MPPLLVKTQNTSETIRELIKTAPLIVTGFGIDFSFFLGWSMPCENNF